MSTLKRMQKLFAVLLVFTFVAGIVAVPGSAYAAKREPMRDLDIDVKKLVSDIEDEDVKEAVLRLNAFGIIAGMGEDGKYHPEMKLTREQFAKILVTSLKMDDAAEAGVGYKSFSDVPADRWSAGFVGVAAGQGLVEGYPDGTFKPTKEVTYAEAITMLVRALGYKDEFLPGGWPGNYLAKGAAKGITKKVKFSDAAGVVNRGDAAILVNNNLDAKVIKPDTYKGNVLELVESEKTLLEDRLELVKAEDARIIANKRIDDGLDEEEIRVFFRKDVVDPASKDQSKEYNKFDEEDEEELDMVEGFNPEPYLGQEVTIYLNDDDEVLYAEVENDDKAYFDYVEELTDDHEITLAKADDDYDFDENASVWVLDGDQYKEYKGKDLQKDEELDIKKDMLGKVGKFVIKNRKIVYAEVMDMGEAYPWLLVMKNDDGLITGINEDDDDFELDLTKDGNYDGVIVLDIDGIEMDVDDLEEGNLLYVQKQEYDGDDYAVVRVVTDNVIEGKLDRVIKDNKIRLDDKDYKVTHYKKDGKQFDIYYSIEDGDDIKCFDMSKEDVENDMEDADEEEIVAYLDAVGRIAYFQTEAKASSGYKYGVVTRVYADNDRLKIFTIDEDDEDDEIVYRVEEEDNVEETARLLNEYGQKLKDSDYKDEKNLTSIKKGSVVKFKLNKAGEIAEDKLYVHDPAHLWKINAKEDFGKDYLPKAYLVDEVKDGNHGDAGIDAKISSDYYAFSVKDDFIVIDAENYKFDKTAEDKKDKDIANINEEYYVTWEDTDDFSAAKWADLADANGIDGFFYVFADDDRETNAKAAIFIGQGSGAASDDEIGIYVLDKFFKDGDNYVEYVAYGDSKVKEKELDNDDNYEGHEHPYIAKEKSNGKLEIIAPNADKKDENYPETKDGFTMVFGQIEERKSDYIKLHTAYNYAHGDEKETFTRNKYNISSKTIVYEEDDKKTTSNLSKGDFVIMVVEKGNNARVIERLTGGEKDDMKKLIGDNVDPEKEDPEDKPTDPDKIDVKATYEDNKVTVKVENAKDAFAVAIYDIDDNRLDQAVLDNNNEAVFGLEERPIFINYRIFDEDGKELKKGRVTVKDPAEEEPAQKVIDKIANLPGVDKLTLDDEDAVVKAREAYEELEDDQKEKVTNIDELEAIEAQFPILAQEAFENSFPTAIKLNGKKLATVEFNEDTKTVTVTIIEKDKSVDEIEGTGVIVGLEGEFDSEDIGMVPIIDPRKLDTLEDLKDKKTKVTISVNKGTIKEFTEEYEVTFIVE